INVLKQKDYSAKIEIDTKINSIKDIIDYIVENNTIIDITIDDIPLEEVISEIYNQSKNKE
ncbi:MAG: ABC transporter, partial [Spirochaetota bacterium]